MNDIFLKTEYQQFARAWEKPDAVRLCQMNTTTDVYTILYEVS